MNNSTIFFAILGSSLVISLAIVASALIVGGDDEKYNAVQAFNFCSQTCRLQNAEEFSLLDRECLCWLNETESITIQIP